MSCESIQPLLLKHAAPLSLHTPKTALSPAGAMPSETFEGQLTRANVQLAVRSGVLAEADAATYWSARRRYRTLSDSNSTTTITKLTQ